MKTGMSTACFFCRLYNEESIRKMAEMGIKNIELFFSAIMEYQKPFTDEIKRICNGEGINICSVHALCTQFEPQLFSMHDRQREEAFTIYRQVLDAAAELSAGIYVFHGPMNLKHAKTLHINYERAGERVTVLAEEAKQRSVKLAYENVHWCWYAQPGFAQKILKNTDSDNLYFTLDIKQAAQSGYDVSSYIDDMGARLSHIHVCDYRNDPKRGMIPCLPFDGEMDWSGMKKQLIKIGYHGLMMLEVYPNDYRAYDELLDNYHKVTKFFE